MTAMVKLKSNDKMSAYFEFENLILHLFLKLQF
jgi:hypothetical protein